MKILLTIGLAAAVALGASSAFAQDKKAEKASTDFIKTAIQHNYAEIDAGQMAQEKGKNPAVKEFGAMMAKDHGEANAKAQSVASQLNVDPPKSADMMHKASSLKLKAMSGDSFDRSYINDMVKDHEADVKKYRQQSAKSDPTGAMAKELLPVLEKHLAEAKKIQGELKQTTGSR